MIWRRLIGRIPFEVPINRIRSPFGEPFNDDNHWVRTLTEYEEGMESVQSSSLHKYHQLFQPRTIFDILPEESRQTLQSSESPPLGLYPWGAWTNRRGGEWVSSRHCGPSAANTVASEWEAFTSLYESLKHNGVRYDLHGYLFGILLIPKDGPKYFLMLGGNHRTAAMYKLGHRSVRVRLLARDYLKVPWVIEKCLRDTASRVVFRELISEDVNFYK